ncbi:MAG TPA: sortase [Anaerolinea thermolimosa]|uniref:Sortase n=1 Tax=Anaerolinea thermolimosa TaxID=229919 RepID=A0A3D1JJV8_9CHLR|nr:sortase [Anaerolinea thermolimosa]GAP06241.1 sortase family [Anaerolinea thermolimosa]HCE18537.1 sortase [Anaerolinea thermolimosa]
MQKIVRLLVIFFSCFLFFQGASLAHADPQTQPSDSQKTSLKYARLSANSLFSFTISPQPAGDPAFVSSEPGVVTDFSLARTYGTIGLLAHNTLAGAAFSQLKTGQSLQLITQDGSITLYRITAIEKYRALTPSSPKSDFSPLDSPGRRMTATELFNHIYATGDGKRLVLQTCLEANGNPSWGRLFIIAELETGTPPLSAPLILYNPAPAWASGDTLVAR